MKPKTYYVLAATLLLLFSLITQQACKKEAENKPPTCEITSPDNGQEITKGDTVTISADAIDSDGSITEVMFFIDDIGKGSATSFPYNYNWNTTNEDLGSHILKATAIDNNGQSTSNEISVTLVAAGPAPLADFTANITSGVAPLTVNFTDQSTNNPTSWQWDFGDGGTSTEQNPAHTYNEGTYTVTLTVTNEYGSDVKTKTDYIVVSGSTFNDPRDGQIYNIVTIGNQTWFAENLKYLPGVSPSSEGSYDNPYYYVYGYRGYSVSEAKATTNYNTYGVLYNWPAALNACPDGWHLPSDREWKTLEMYLGMSQSEADGIGWRGTNEGEKLKSTNGWYEDGNGTDEVGFSALPGGYRNNNGNFDKLEINGYWWSATEINSSYAWNRFLSSFIDMVYRGDGSNKEDGFSIRCVRD